MLIRCSSWGAVYPEYFLELYSQEDEEAEKAAAEAPETAEAPEGGDEAAGFSNAVEEAPEERLRFCWVCIHYDYTYIYNHI